MAAFFYAIISPWSYYSKTSGALASLNLIYKYLSCCPEASGVSASPLTNCINPSDPELNSG
jgi:hypothetical protein